jgi:hypothetical protein
MRRVLSIASLLLAVGGCATRSVSIEEYRAEIVDTRMARSAGGDPRYFLTLAYLDRAGANCQVTVQVDQVSWLRYGSVGRELCLFPSVGTLRLGRCN